MARRFVAVARQEHAAVFGKVLADIDQDAREYYLLACQDQESGEAIQRRSLWADGFVRGSEGAGSGRWWQPGLHLDLTSPKQVRSKQSANDQCAMQRSSNQCGLAS